MKRNFSLAFLTGIQNFQVRDRTLSRIKSNIELMVATNGGKKAVIIPHSMGVLYFLHFMKWVEAPAPMGGGGGPDWCARHIKAVLNIGGPFLGVPKAVSGLFSAEARDIAFARYVKLPHRELCSIGKILSFTSNLINTFTEIIGLQESICFRNLICITATFIRYLK